MLPLISADINLNKSLKEHELLQWRFFLLRWRIDRAKKATHGIFLFSLRICSLLIRFASHARMHLLFLTYTES
jgi:hypothetical protein